MDAVDKLNLDKNNFEKSMSNATAKLGEESVYYFKGNFAKGSFDGKHWEDTKEPTDHPILVKTGRLRDSIRYIKNPDGSVSIVSNVPYASYINDGTDKMVAREIIGESKELTAMLTKMIDSEVKKTFK